MSIVSLLWTASTRTFFALGVGFASNGCRINSVMARVRFFSSSRFVPRLMKRARTPDYSSRRVFGVPLSIIQQRHGQPLPQCILYAMRRLRRSAADSESVGVFRKSGVRSRILALRNEVEADPGELITPRDRRHVGTTFYAAGARREALIHCE